jgi:hypothetical protein
VDPRLVILGLATLLLICAVVYLISAVASGRRQRRRGARPGEQDIAQGPVSDLPIELGGWAPSAEPDAHELRVGANFEDIAPGTVHGQDRLTRHEVVDVEPGATLLSIEDLIRHHAESPVPERTVAPGAPIETLFRSREDDTAGPAGPAMAPVIEEPVRTGMPEPYIDSLETRPAVHDQAPPLLVPMVAASSRAQAETGAVSVDRHAPAPVPAASPKPADMPWFVEAEVLSSQAAPPVSVVVPEPAPVEPVRVIAAAPLPALVPEPRPLLDTSGPTGPVRADPVPELEELLGGLIRESSTPPMLAAPEPEPEPEPESEPMFAPVPTPESEPMFAPAPVPAPVPAPESEPMFAPEPEPAAPDPEPVLAPVPAFEPEFEPDPLLLLESLLTESMASAAPAVQSWDTPVAEAPAHPVPVRPVARDVRQVPVYRMVAPIELWFSDGPPRVGIRPGTPTYLKYQRLAQVLLTDLKKANSHT